MTEQVLVELYSLYAQVCGIFIALVAVYVFFRIGKINELLVGQGISIYKMQRDILNPQIEISGATLNDKYLRRLRDAIDRMNIYGIEESLIRLSIEEQKPKNKEHNSNYDHVLPIFIQTKKHLKKIKIISSVSILLYSLTIIFCLAAIALTDIYYDKHFDCILNLFWSINTFGFISYIFSGYLIYTTINDKIGFEKNKDGVCFDLRNSYPKIDKLY